MSDQDTKATASVKLSDPTAIGLLEQYRKQTGDKTLGRTLVRLITAAWHSGLSLSPDAERND